MAIDENGTFLIAAFVETVAYGIALALFVLSITTLIRKKRRTQRLNIPIIIAAPFLFLFATVHIAGVWVRTYKAFVTFSAAPQTYWALITTVEKTVTQAALIGAVGLADAMTIYRTLMIWELNLWIIIIPTLTCIGTVVSGITIIVVQHQVNVHTSIFAATVTKWIQSWLACSLVTTGLCTAAIIYKLVSIQLSFPAPNPIYDPSRSLVSRSLRIFVESAALYSINNLLYISLYTANVLVEAWVSGLDVPIASITFSLIIIRLEIAVNRPLTEFSKTTTGQIPTSQASTIV